MTLVIDASVAAKWLFKEIDSDKARVLLEEMERGRLSLIAPELVLVEIGSMLWKRVVREGVSVAESAAQYERLISLRLALVGMADLVDPAFRLAARHRHPIYDCIYLALALEADCDVVTADEKFHRVIGHNFRQVRLLRDWRPEAHMTNAVVYPDLINLQRRRKRLPTPEATSTRRASN